MKRVSTAVVAIGITLTGCTDGLTAFPENFANSEETLSDFPDFLTIPGNQAGVAPTPEEFEIARNICPSAAFVETNTEETLDGPPVYLHVFRCLSDQPGVAPAPEYFEIARNICPSATFVETKTEEKLDGPPVYSHLFRC